jgi:alkylated DNA nucleotide flippase Atl1
MKTRKSWREKMDPPGLPKLVAIPERMRKRFGDGEMLLPHPREVEAIIRTVPEGNLITLTEIREELARRHGAAVTCPLVTGIFVRLAAEAAEEQAGSGATRITPYWRVVKADGSLNPKFPGGVAQQSERLSGEGHRITPARGNRPPRVALAASR